MTKKFLLFAVIASLFLSFSTHAQNYVNESFDGSWLPTGWSDNNVYNAGTDGGGCGCVTWTQTYSGGGVVPSGIPTHSGSGMAWYNSWDIYFGNVDDLITPAMDFSTYGSTGINQVSFWYYDYCCASDYTDVYVNTSASSSGATYLGTVYPDGATTGWVKYTYNIPSSFASSSNVYIIFEGVSYYNEDQFLDDVSVDHIPPCSGTPSVSINRITGICSGRNFTLTATTSPALAAGFNYQWQSATSATGPWSGISGATNPTYTTSITSTTYFRCQVQCSYSGLTGTSNSDTIAINPAALCPCVPDFYYSYYFWDAACAYNITNFTCNAVNTVNEAGQSCSYTVGDPGYYDRTTVSADTLVMYRGGNYNGSITDNYGYYGAKQIWIDYNDDGTFSNSEAVTPLMMSGGYISIYTHTYQIFVPLNAPLGPHRMRVRYAQTFTYTGPNINTSLYNAYLDPCSYYYCGSIYCDYYYYGTTYDYEVKIIQAPACSGAPSVTIVPAGPQNLCSGIIDTLYATSAPANGYSYQWQLSNNGGSVWSNVSGATNTWYAFTVSSSTAGWYRLNVTCSNSSTTAPSNTVIVNMKAAADCPCSPPQYYYTLQYGYNPCSSYKQTVDSFTGNAGSYLRDASTTCSGTGYEDRTAAFTPVDYVQGNNYTASITLSSRTRQTGAIWIDFNDDGVFNNSAPELVTTPYYYPTVTSNTHQFPITIPSTANTGRHRMRVRNVYMSSTSPTSYDPCSYTSGSILFYYGQAKDYYCNILSSVPTPTLSPSTTQNICAGSNISITATTSVAGSVTFSWTGPNGFTSSTTTSAGSNTITISSAVFVNSGAYQCRVINASNVPSYPAIDTVFVWPYPSFVSGVTSNSPVCTPTGLQISGIAVPSNATYSWTGPSGFTSTNSNFTRTPSTASMSGTYSVTVNNHGCTTSGSVTATVNQTPSISSTSQTDPTTCICNCGSITLNGLNASTTYTVNYSKNGSAVSPVNLTSNASGQVIISGLNAAIYSNITVTLNGCPSAAVGPITLNNPSVPPTPTVGTNAPVCLNTPLSFSGTESSSYTWTWSGPGSWTYTSTGSTSNPVKTASAAFTDSGNYLVYVTDALGCTSPPITINVVVKPRPNTPTLVSNNAALPTGLCEGSTLALSMTTTTPPGTAAGISYIWTDPTGSTTNPSTSSTYSSTSSVSVSNVANNMAGNWAIYSVLNGCTSTSPATVYTYIKWKPGVPGVSSNSPVCAGVSYNPNAIILNSTDTSAGVTYTWSGPNGFSVSNSALTIQTINSPSTSATGTYTVYASKNGCNSASNSVNVTVNPSPTAPSVAPRFTAYCQYDPSIVLTATGTNLRWYTASTGGIASTTAPTPSTSIAGLFLWYVTQTNTFNCESPAANDSVLVKGKPSIPYGTTSLTYCQGDKAAILTAIGANLLWYNGDASGPIGSGTAIPPVPNTGSATTLYYYVTQTLNGCESNPLKITVLVKPKPSKPGVTNKEYCQNDFALPLSASGSNLLWYTSSSGGLGTIIAPTPSTSYADTQYYYVTQTVNGCESDRAQVVIVVNYTPNALIVASQPYVCQYDSIYFTYFGNALLNATYNWSMPVGASILHGGVQGPIWIKFDSAGKRIVTLQVTNKTCKSPLTTYTVDVRQAPYAPTNIKNEVCQNDILNVSLGYANENIDKFDWDFDGAQTVYGSEGGGPFGIRYSSSGLHIIKMVAWSNSCPSIPLYDTVNVHPLADAHIGDISNSSICAGDSVMFTAERYNPGYLYQWEPSIYFGTQNNQGQVYGFIERSGYIQLHVTTEFGCTSTDSSLVSAMPCCEVYFPNAFTPNGDGKNDVFRPISKGNQVYKNFRVTNRWGQVMFETVNPKVGWDGKFQGTLQDLGTYYYYIKYQCANGKVYEEKGEVLLIK